MKYKSKLLVLPVLCSLFLGLHKVSADDVKFKNEILGVNSSRSAAVIKSNKDESSNNLLKDVGLFAFGAACSAVGVKTYDLLSDNKELNDLKRRLYDTEVALENANAKIESLKSDLKTEHDINVCNERDLKVLQFKYELERQELQKYRNETAKSSGKTLSPSAIAVLKNFIADLATVVTPHASVLEDFVCLMMHQKKLNCPAEFYYETRRGLDWENNGRFAEGNISTCHKSLNEIAAWLAGKHDLDDLTEYYEKWKDGIQMNKATYQPYCSEGHVL